MGLKAARRPVGEMDACIDLGGTRSRLCGRTSGKVGIDLDRDTWLVLAAAVS